MPRKSRRAFTLIELMVVMLIIAVIIAIVLPSLGAVQRSVRANATKMLLTQISNASASFYNDHKRMPGYFSVRDMAHTDNQVRGFADIQNIMLDLAGFTTANPGTGMLTIGPLNAPTSQLTIDPSMLGVAGQGNDKLYFVPDAKNWAPQNITGQQVASVADHQALPSVVDAFRNPLLVWRQDDTAVGKVTTVQAFAKPSISGPNDPSARYYYVPNAAFLYASALGARGYNQATDSMLGSAGNPPTYAPESLCGFLGNPAYPYRDPAAPAGGPAPTVPSAGRAPLVLHSAGIDGIYLGKKDRGAKQFVAGRFDYQQSFVRDISQPEIASNFYLDKDDKREIVDLVRKFDDIISGAGN